MDKNTKSRGTTMQDILP